MQQDQGLSTMAAAQMRARFLQGYLNSPRHSREMGLNVSA